VTEIFESLARMRDAGIALLLVEQNVRRASAISSSCYVIEKGRIIKHGVPADVLADDAIRQRLSV
jgi:branched-chain amino acid transport system ATP-binding protein